MKKGFTILELLVVLALIGMVAGLSVPFFMSFQASTNLRTHASTIKQALRIAQQKAIAGQEASDWGVYFNDASSKYILYKGNNYAGRDANFDREYEYPAVFNLATDFGDDVSFTINSGFPSAAGTTTISSQNNESSYIVVSPFGLIQIND